MVPTAISKHRMINAMTFFTVFYSNTAFIVILTRKCVMSNRMGLDKHLDSTKDKLAYLHWAGLLTPEIIMILSTHAQWKATALIGIAIFRKNSLTYIKIPWQFPDFPAKTKFLDIP